MSKFQFELKALCGNPMTTSWTAVDAYFDSQLIPHDDVLASSLTAAAKAGLPPHDVAPNQGKLLYLLAKAVGAERILEIGTLAAYSTIWLARALPRGGKIVTLEANDEHARVARQNINSAGLKDIVDLRTGKAVETLEAMDREGCAPFDLIFIDADKQNNVQYLSWSLRFSREGTLILADNVVRDGKVVEADNDDPNVKGVRAFTERLALEPRLEATSLQTVGRKGWDGFILARVTAEPAATK
jgi:predicted O-methyltransferase YrrM